ncbi:phosphate regulon sensor histidine kinase PhoR [Halotalea alkalilenta]|uniref:Phosphate regulon sensor protein PhoR n=1 Tax=Halotalea alkalilenta TaxID=376489 RepID=A0A172YBA1_9GAMM|nr:phosphate regulon sensor histidine kinase PhoR [Halotalea alkalilenta]ANF56392.1 PAS domain-containing sensor histidine kinase [Halotalea alkalilenta]
MRHWTREFLLLALCGALGTLLGGHYGHSGFGLAAGLGLYLLLTFRQLRRLYRWAKAPDSANPPSATGLWGELFDRLYRYQKQERQQQAHLQGVIDRVERSSEAMYDAMVILDAHAALDSWNAAATRMLGFEQPQDRGQHVTNLLRHPRFVHYFLAQNYDDPLELPSPVDESRTLQFQITPFGDHERLMVVRDITRLQRLEQMRRDFVANVSHELRTPLTVFTGYLEPLAQAAETALPPRLARGVAQMEQQADRMRHLIDDLLMLSRLENEQSFSPRIAVDVAALIQQVHSDGVALSKGRQNFELKIETSAELLGAREELRSALTNLVSNAVRYAGNGRRIELRWYLADSGEGRLSVSDDGEGIERRHLSRLTERFYRVDKSRSSATGGTGLGLAIVKHVLLRHQGRLEIESSLGRGARFTLCFPAERVSLPTPSDACAD